MTFGEMKTAVAAYMTRSQLGFIEGNLDLLGLAINQARKWCERDHMFELAKVPATTTINLTTGGSLATVYLSDGVTPVSVNLIERAYLSAPGGGTFPIDVLSRGAHRRQMRKVLQGVERASDVDALHESGLCGISLVRHGMLLYLVPANATALGSGPDVTVGLDIVRWMDDYKDDDDTDFFLQELHDLLLLRTIYRLNFFLKEDDRVNISERAMERMWDSTMKWDASQRNGADDLEY